MSHVIAHEVTCKMIYISEWQGHAMVLHITWVKRLLNEGTIIT